MLKLIRKATSVINEAVLAVKALKEMNEKLNPANKEVIDRVGGIPVVVISEALEIKYNVPEQYPGALVTQKIKGSHYIVINKGMLDLPANVYEAIIQHEVGHVKCKHITGIVAIYKIIRYGRNINYEFEADLYSQKNTGNMLKALEHLKSLKIYNNVELDLRIDALRKAT